MITRVVLLVLGLLHLANGVWILLSPAGFYAVPAVTGTGPMNYHFIIDIGLAFLASGTGLVLGFRSGAVAAALALAGATWPALHAVFHVWCWFKHGFPADPGIAATDAVGVVLIGFVGLAVAISRARKEGVI